MSKFNFDEFPKSETGKQMLHRVSPIYSDSYVAKWLYEVMGMELDDVKKRFAEMREQVFTGTVTWGIEYQEHKFSIEPDDSLSLEERRARLYRKKTNKSSLNPKRIEQYFKNAWGLNVEVDETVEPGYINLSFDNKSGYNIVSAIKDFVKIKPSHLSISPSLKLKENVNLYYGLANIPIGRKTIKLSFPEGHKHNAHTGVALSWGGVKHIGVQSPGDFQYDSFIAFADAKTGRKTIGFDTDDLHYTPLGDLELFFKTGAVYINAGKKHIAACEDRKTVYEAETRAGITNVVYGTRVIGGLKYLDDMLSKAFGGMYSIRRGTMKIGGLR